MKGVLDYMICTCKCKMRGVLDYMICTSGTWMPKYPTLNSVPGSKIITQGYYVNCTVTYKTDNEWRYMYVFLCNQIIHLLNNTGERESS